MTSPETNDRESEPVPLVEKRAYEPPVLTELGTLRELTAGGGFPDVESNGGSIPE